MRCFGHVPPGRDPEHPGHAGGTMFFGWPGNALGFPRKSWAKCLERAKSGPLYLVPDWVEGQQPKLKIMDRNGG